MLVAVGCRLKPACARVSTVGFLLRCQSAQAGGNPRLMTATVEGLGENATTLIQKDAYKLLVDEPPKLGGKGLAPNPLTYALASLVGCTQYTIHMIGWELRIPPINRIAWSAEGVYDLRGVQGQGGVSARFQGVRVRGTVDGQVSQDDLDRIAGQVERRCILAATFHASGGDVQLSLTKGSVHHDCQPACELHRMAERGPGGPTGSAEGHVSHAGDAPQPAGTQGHGKARARASIAALPMSRRSLHSCAVVLGDGEDVAREHMQADKTPQLQKSTSEQEAPETRGGSYAGAREAPQTQAPLGGSQEGILRQASELSSPEGIHPKDIGTAEGGKPVDKGAAPAPGFTERMLEKKRGEQESQLGQFPGGQE